MKKYLSLYASLFKASFIADLEYRVNFLTRIFTDIVWYIAQIVGFEVLYRHTSTIGDWNLSQTRVFLGLLFVIDAIYMILFHDNLDRFASKVHKGELDLILAKPVNSQFMVSLQRASTALIGNFLIGSAWLVYSLYGLESLEPLRLLWLLILIPSGVIVVYITRFVILCASVIFTKAENLQFIWYQMYKLGMRPDSIYTSWVKYVLLTILPFALVASVPARALLEPPNLVLFAWAVILAGCLLYWSTLFWKFCLKYYSSASS
jgi:ABC-2 type transport system permease protein